MFWALISAICLYLAAGASPSFAAGSADTSPKTSWQQVSPYDQLAYDADAERELLDRTNMERARVGRPPLKVDDGLVAAARAHAVQMAAQSQLSHQFSGEPSLSQRVAVSSTLHLNRTGENVAMAGTADDAHAALMSSPPHRDNLLSADFNVAGFGVVRKGNRLYVTQDFGTSLATYSVKQAEELVAASVEQLRAQSNMPRLQRVDIRGVQASACSMAKADSLKAASTPPGSYALRYTSMEPEKLPSDISQVIAQRGLHAYSAGTCYARTQRYPNGAYWVVLVFY